MSEPRVALEDLHLLADGLDHPEGICIDPSGILYVGGEQGQIYRVEADETATELTRTGGFMLGLAADGEGRVYAVDTGLKCVWRFDPRTGSRDVFARGPVDRPFANPNWGAFGPDGAYYLSDSGEWGANDGLIWRVDAGGPPEVWTTQSSGFPNGLAVSADGRRLYAVESLPGAIIEVEIRADGSAGARRVLHDFPLVVPDGVALTSDGGLVVSCYRPDAIYTWNPHEGLVLLAEDPRGTALAAPTNVVFTGPDLDIIVVPNLGRWHLTRFRCHLRGVALHYPTRALLGS